MADEIDKKEDEKKETEVVDEKSEQEQFDSAFEEAIVEPKEEGEEKDTDADKKEVVPEKKETEVEKKEPEKVDWEARARAAEADRDKEVQKTKSWEGRITAANKRAEEAERKIQERDSTQAKVKTEKEDLPGGEEDEQVLTDFVSEFPSLEKPIKAIAKRIAEKIVSDRMKEIEPRFNKVESIEKQMKDTEDASHFDKIERAHSDWREVRDSGKLKLWIDAQPGYVKRALDKVVTEGSTEEVIEMFNQYKESIPSEPSTTPRKDKTSNKKAQDLLAVDSSPSGSPKGKTKADKDDFDAAWEESLRD